ncbi:cytochrome oxidase assembly protein-domain-containing protein [Multifurca ochricompacta]|uniref:Cytochrome oxidase assembly protein-domain-containing protein n=1 Tax=Multifurca ochricompacta TaxID=376703 RepID=A0AAD4LXR4_9AGAM|nr:cytochrome oxidase assembly protein-domain-containing protein [Multifurca ochricompacta]
MFPGLLGRALRVSGTSLNTSILTGLSPFSYSRGFHHHLIKKTSQVALFRQQTSALVAPPRTRAYSSSSSSFFKFLFFRNKRNALPKSGALLESPPRFFSSNGSDTHPPAAELPVLSPPPVANWLLLSSTLVIAVIVVGGITRLTESGLSITEWRPITGILPPLSQAEWKGEFDKYKATPEFRLLNSRISLDDFKSIYYMEWGHRILGRVIGLAFVLPLAYFTFRQRLSRSLRGPLIGMAALLGAQGVLGWYMVQSGLEPTNFIADDAVPRVSQYRLAAHLGAALVLYAGMFAAGLAVKTDWRFARDGVWSRLRDGRTWEEVLRNPVVKRFKLYASIVTGLVLLTALSGAFVAGLDAGLVYNEFPLMGGRLTPPLKELLSPQYATTTTTTIDHNNNKKRNDNPGLWRNFFENPTTVQFDHRLLAMTTYLSTALLFASSRRASFRAALPHSAVRATAFLFAMANVQVVLGISTLLYLVPVPLAASHQVGSVALLSAALHVLLALRRPGAAARAWRQANLARTRNYAVGGRKVNV